MAYTLVDAISREIRRKELTKEQLEREITALHTSLRILSNGAEPVVVPKRAYTTTPGSRGQTDAILKYLNEHPEQNFTADDLWKSGFKYKNKNSLKASLQCAYRKNKLDRARNQRGEFIFQASKKS